MAIPGTNHAFTVWMFDEWMFNIQSRKDKMLFGIFLWGTIWYSDLEVESNLLGNTCLCISRLAKSKKEPKTISSGIWGEFLFNMQ